MMLNINEEYLVNAIIKDCIKCEIIDEQLITDSAYEVLESYIIEEVGLLQLLNELTVKKLKKMNIEVLY